MPKGKLKPIHLVNDDCLVAMKKLQAGSVDLILTDLPYGTTACKWDTVIPFEPLWENYKRLVKRNAAIVLTASQPFTSALVMSNPKWFRCEWIWRKNAGSNFGTTRYQPMKEHESVLVFAAECGTYNPIMQPRAESGAAMVKAGVKSKARTGDYAYGNLHKGYDNSDRDPQWRVPSSVQAFNRERGLHPNQKPVALMEYLIKTYSNEGDTVLDCCMGSGTTGVACKNLNRKFIGIEKDPDIFQTAKERINATPIGLPLTSRSSRY